MPSLNNSIWPQWSAAIAAPAAPEEFVPAAMERLMDQLRPFVVDVKGVRAKFPARNSVKRVGFDTADEKKQYEITWDTYVKRMAMLGKDTEFGWFQQLVARMKFSQSSELIKKDLYARSIADINSRGKAAVVAVKFKETIGASIKALVNNHGYKRSDISIIWGGMGGTFTADGKVKLKEKKIKESMFKMLAPEDLDLLRSLNVRLLVVEDFDTDKIIKEVELSEEIDEREKLSKAGLVSVSATDLSDMKLGSQNARVRQAEIDAFQCGKTKVCFFTFKAGGVGLSLHHHDSTCLPRESIIAVTDSAIELLQGIGRAPRLTSLSETRQTMLFYEGTVEEEIAANVSKKLLCHKEVVGQQRETWEDIIVNAARAHKREFVADVDESESIEDVIEDEDENNNQSE